MSEDEIGPAPSSPTGQHPDDISDGYHTFRDLYDHRHALFMLLATLHGGAWKSRLHSDGEPSYPGSFVAGLTTSAGLVTYHMPDRLWDLCPWPERERSEWDGHSSHDVVDRLMQATRDCAQRRKP